MDVKKVSTKDIFPLEANADYKNLHSKLEKILGESNPFAKFHIGAGFYVWSSSESEWIQLTNAGSFKREEVEHELAEVRKAVATKLGGKTVDSLFMVPDDGYIYFKDSADGIKILLTGWGFKKPNAYVPPVPPVPIDVGEDFTVSLSFSFDGVKLHNYEFGLQLKHNVKRLATDDSGVYTTKAMKPGNHFVLVDLNSGKQFSLDIVDSRTEYDFDVTAYAKCEVVATYEEAPVVGEAVTVEYNGKEFSASTDAAGRCVFSLPYHAGVNIKASMRDSQVSETVNEHGNVLRFDFKAPAVERDVTVTVRNGGEPVANEFVTVNYDGQTYIGDTDANGKFVKSVTLVNGAACRVSVDGYDTQEKVLSEHVSNEFLFDKEVLPPPVPESFSPYIRIVGDNGFVGANYPISVELHGAVTNYTSDENGCVYLPDVFDGEVMKVTDGLNPENVEEYSFDHELLEYEFHVPYTSGEENADLKIMVRDCKGKPVKCDMVRFVQDGREERLVKLDDEGNTYLSRDTFLPNEPITATILGAEHDYAPIEFKVEEEENEYLLQEQKQGSKWWKILLEILLVLLAFFAFWFLLEFFLEAARELRNLIY